MSTTNEQQGGYGDGCLTRAQIIALGMDPDIPWNKQRPNPEGGWEVALHDDVERKVYTGEPPQREPVFNYDWLGNMDDAAKGYVDSLREPFRSDPLVAGIALEAFRAGRNLPALQLAKASTMIAEGRLMVVKTARIDAEGNLVCQDKACLYTGPFIGFGFCPGCGSKIIE